MSQCDTCAFGKNDGAGSEPKNRLQGLIAARGLVPFWCHHRPDGTEWEWGNSLSAEQWKALKPGERKICSGWKKAVAYYKRQGRYDFPKATPAENTALRNYQRHLASDCLRQVDAYVAEKDPKQKAIEKGRLDDLICAVFDIPEIRRVSGTPPLKPHEAAQHAGGKEGVTIEEVPRP